MSEARQAQEYVLKKVASRAVIIDSAGSVLVDGTKLKGLDGQRAMRLFLERVREDVRGLGLSGTTTLYANLSNTPGRLGKAVGTSLRISRELDAEYIAKK